MVWEGWRREASPYPDRQTGRLGFCQKCFRAGSRRTQADAHHVRVDPTIEDGPIFRRPRGSGNGCRPCEHGLGLLGAEALRHHRGDRIAGMQLRARLTPLQLHRDRLARRQRR